jgi:hypothetical protein
MLRRILPVILGSGLLVSGAGPERAPILVELFTSEGCSSCPPADRLLEALDPRVIVLSEHVDYWDHLGWRDPFSSHASTLRQQAYAHRLGTQGPYTPQMIVNGSTEFVGNDPSRASAAIAGAAKQPSVAIRLVRQDDQLEITTDPALRSADVILAIADVSQQSKVNAGENQGRQLRHVSILRKMKKVGSVKKGEPFHRSVPLEPDAQGKRLIVFLQDSDLGRVSGAGLLVP